jgi:hypothetical protein
MLALRSMTTALSPKSAPKRSKEGSASAAMSRVAIKSCRI